MIPTEDIIYFTTWRAQENPYFVNYRYPLDKGQQELVFGSIARQICQMGFLIHDKNIVGVATRPLLVDTDCGEHLAWIFTPVFGEQLRRVFVLNHLTETLD